MRPRTRHPGPAHRGESPQDLLPLPGDTREAFRAGHLRPGEGNPGLLLDRFYMWREGKEGTGLDNHFSSVRAHLRGLRSTVQGLLERRRAWEGAMRAQGWAVRPFSMRTATRVVVGLGAETVWETGITLHRLYGFPYIPASSLKGVARARALEEVAHNLGVPFLPLEGAQKRRRQRRLTPLDLLEALVDEPDPQEQVRLLNGLKGDPAVREREARVQARSQEEVEEALDPLRRVFGTRSASGRVVFLDALPEDSDALEMDILNPHYPDYYRGEAVPPADYLSPSPVFLLAVPRGKVFHFCVAAPEQESAGQAEGWLRTALKERGVGARRASDYGYWEEV